MIQTYHCSLQLHNITTEENTLKSPIRRERDGDEEEGLRESMVRLPTLGDPTTKIAGRFSNDSRSITSPELIDLG